MIKNFIVSGTLAILFLGVAFVPAHAQAQSVADQIQTLLAQIETLQKKLAEIKGEIRVIIKDGLREGMTDADIEDIQELLATDPAIYPEGRITGFFGPMTKEAIKRFQTRHELAATGEINAETRELLEKYLGERFGDKIPAGLLRAPGIMKKVKDGLCDDDSSHHARGPLCKKYSKNKEHVHGDDHEHESDDDNDDVVTKRHALRAIQYAEKELRDVTEDMEDESSENEEVAELLLEAEDLIESAKEAFDDGDFAEAKRLANEAEEMIDSAEDTL